jgi:hypothetical protein
MYQNLNKTGISLVCLLQRTLITEIIAMSQLKGFYNEQKNEGRGDAQ